MDYTFEILGVSPLLYLFDLQSSQPKGANDLAVEYVGARHCTLDAALRAVEPIAPKRGWDWERLRRTAVEAWMQKADSISYWKQRLEDAGRDDVLLVRVAESRDLRLVLEGLL
ncbi:MAG: hypothetical protein Fur0042_00310 [Cyanophyceae cyanobacterium]